MSAIYQLNKRQYEVLTRMANLDEELPLYTVISPSPLDEDALRTELVKERESALDLQVLGFIRDDEEKLLQIAAAVSEKVDRATKVYTITPLGYTMFHNNARRSVN